MDEEALSSPVRAWGRCLTGLLFRVSEAGVRPDRLIGCILMAEGQPEAVRATLIIPNLHNTSSGSSPSLILPNYELRR
jgi:hypothetical protein